MFNSMSANEIITKVSAIRNGTMARIKYWSELPLRAAYKKQGMHLYRITEVTVRFGVDYENISSVIEKKAAGEIGECTYETAYHWLEGLKNKICHNDNTGKDYVRFSYLPHGDNRKVCYEVVKVEETYFTEALNDEEKDFVIPSYWSRKGNLPEVQNICFEHIISIG